jgi:hypothetical protein
VLFHEVEVMARNVVQFQEGLSEAGFEQQYGTEEQCQAFVVAARWADGFECLVCGGKQYCAQL